MAYLLSIVSSFFGVISFILAFIKEDIVKNKIYKIAVLSVFILLFSLFFLNLYSRNNSEKNRLQRYDAIWSLKDIDSLSNGELKGAILEGMIILEPLRHKSPENYTKLNKMVYQGHDPGNNDKYWEDRDNLIDTFQATLILVRGFSLGY